MTALRIGAALRRELPALDELRADASALPGAEGQELALQAPLRAATATTALAPSTRALSSLVATTGRLREPGAMASLGEAAGPVRAMLDAVEELLAMSRSVDHQRKLGVRA
ncbi:MAG: hypothetical protein JJ863_11765 [Deltaproteobacteria bacterium]|nr:hypothetical protein [Deltaproteobacteria bacterium]